MAFKAAPLNSAFMAMSIIGFLFSVIYVWSISMQWGFAFGVVFAVMFIAAMISMTYGPSEGRLH
jgi:multisubunit Na+/H+ antiporter MnhB subunit